MWREAGRPGYQDLGSLLQCELVGGADVVISLLHVLSLRRWMYTYIWIFGCFFPFCSFLVCNVLLFMS